MRAGFGLPTWKFSDGVPTDLWSADAEEHGNERFHYPVPLNYGQVMALGARPDHVRRYLWRSQIGLYGLSRYTWQRFLADFARTSREIQESKGAEWTSPFHWAESDWKDPSKVAGFDTYRLFSKSWLPTLKAALEELSAAPGIHPTDTTT